MRLASCLCVLLLVAVFVSVTDARKTFSSRRKSGGSNRRTQTSTKQKPPAQPSTPHKADPVNTNFLNSERAGSSHSTNTQTQNTHYRGDPFNSKPTAPDFPKQTVPHSTHTNGPIGFEKLGNQGNQKLGFDKVNSEAQHKPAGANVPSVPSAPAYPVGNPPYPGGSLAGRPGASVPNGPPPAYPGYGSPNTGSHTGSYEPPPAYPGRPVNAPPVYSPNNPSYNQRNPAQPGVGGYPNQQAGYQQSSNPQPQSGYQQSGYPHQQGSYPGQSYPGQQNFGYPNSAGNVGNYPNQGYNQGFGAQNGGFGNSNPGGYGQSYPGGYGQSYPGFGGNSYGGSPFGHTNSYGGSPFGSSNYGGNSFGNSGYGNPQYNPSNFGYSSNPGFFGSQSPYPGYSGGHNNFGYHKKSRFGGLPIPIPIPIPIPLGGFGGFGGHSHNHRLLGTFVKNQTISNSDNTTTNVYILNNSTVTPCTTDQFIYKSLNVTVMSCTAGNCTAVKVFVTTNVSGEAAVHSAGLTMCLEPNATYSTFADNVNPTVSDVHNYWMRVCKEFVVVNSTGNVTEQVASNVTLQVTETVVNETIASEANVTTDQPVNVATPASIVESTTVPSISENATMALSTINSTDSNSTLSNSTGSSNSSFCETFHCSWIEMCLPSIELVDSCATQDCPFTRTGYQPCIRIKMCKSPSTPISTFATLNTTISRIDQFNNITSVNDIANLTLISYIPPVLPANCSQDATDPGCQAAIPSANVLQEVCAPSNSTEAADGNNSKNGTICIPPSVGLPQDPISSSVDGTTTEAAPSTTPIR